VSHEGAIRLGDPSPAGSTEPAQKKPRVEEPAGPPTTTGGLLTEAAFAAANPGPITIQIKLPKDDTNAAWNLNGQQISVTLPEGVATTTKAVKGMAASAELGGIPLGKFQLKAKAGFLKDSQSLAAVNIGGGSVLELSVKRRGGKR
jgi:splicing factor 3A subunit 1